MTPIVVRSWTDFMRLAHAARCRPACSTTWPCPVRSAASRRPSTMPTITSSGRPRRDVPPGPDVRTRAAGRPGPDVRPPLARRCPASLRGGLPGRPGGAVMAAAARPGTGRGVRQAGAVKTWKNCGHSKTPENTVPTSKPSGRCRICSYAATKRWRRTEAGKATRRTRSPSAAGSCWPGTASPWPSTSAGSPTRVASAFSAFARRLRAKSWRSTTTTRPALCAASPATPAT
jgi:hypothetical protein